MKVVAGQEDLYQLSFNRGEKLMSSLNQFAREYKIKGGQLTGLGAVNEVRLAYYDLKTKKYYDRIFNDCDYELINFTGNLTLKDGFPFVHAHISISDHQFNTFSGHLMEATVAILAEIFITPLGVMPERKMNETIGLYEI